MSLPRAFRPFYSARTGRFTREASTPAAEVEGDDRQRHARKVRPEEPLSNPDVSESEDAGPFRVIGLEALVRIKLNAFRDKDRMHLRDLFDVGLVDADWTPRLPKALSERLQSLLDNPEA